VPQDKWDALKAELCETGDWEAVDRAAVPAPEAPLAARQAEIDRLFAGDTLRDISTRCAMRDGFRGRDAGGDGPQQPAFDGLRPST
jgi:enoyl-CoA hydratase